MKRTGCLGFAALALAGCAGDGLVGTWQTTVQDLGVDAVSTITFDSGGTAVEDWSTTNPSTATQYPGCAVRVHETGVTYTEGRTTTADGSSAMSVTFTPAVTFMASEARTGCANPSDDTESAPVDNGGQATSGPITWTYTIAGNTLTLMRPGTVTITFTRQ